MRFITEFRSQIIFGLAQITIIFFGTLSTAAMIKVRSAGIAGNLEIAVHPLSQFVRDWGAMLMVFPLAWTIGTVLLDRREDFNFGLKATIVSGLISSAILVFFFMIAVVYAARSPLLRVIE